MKYFELNPFDVRLTAEAITAAVRAADATGDQLDPEMKESD